MELEEAEDPEENRATPPPQSARLRVKLAFFRVICAEKNQHNHNGDERDGDGGDGGWNRR